MTSRFFLMLGLGLLFVTAGCTAGGRSAGVYLSADAADHGGTAFRVDERVLYEACLERCRRDDELARMTVKGCVPGCDMARENFVLYDSVFTSEAQCRDAVERYAVEEQTQVMKSRCDERFSHLYHRKGCKDAADAYYRILFPALCKDRFRL